MNTLYKIGDLKIQWQIFYVSLGQVLPNLPRLKWPNLPQADYFQISRDSRSSSSSSTSSSSRSRSSSSE